MMSQPHIAPTPAGTSLAGQTIIITGGNSGLGLEAARQYITLNASCVILACRSLSKGEEAVKYLNSHPTVKSTNPGVNIKVMTLDLDDETSVMNFTTQVKKELDSLDILVLNGGVNFMNYQVSKSGHERVIQVNYHSNVLLALELLPLLKSTASQRGQPSRLTFIGSGTHKMQTLNKTPLDKDETVTHHWDDKKKYHPLQRYSDSKLMVTAFTEALARHVDPSKVIVNCVCPGMVSTGLDANLPIWLKPIMWIFHFLIDRTPEVGARTYVYATSVAGVETHGKWLQHNQIAEYVYWDLHLELKDANIKINRTDAILTKPEGKILMQKAWAEALESVKKIDPNFDEQLI
jgi:NAD(P)-dependent dehydrogenase (short-subunit alcohol dehydrogenase family)